MTDIDVNSCGCCREIWNRSNMKSISAGEHTLYLCPDCYTKLEQQMCEKFGVSIRFVSIKEKNE